MRTTTILPAFVLAGAALGCGADAADTEGSVATTLTDTSVAVAPASAPAGSVTFDATNAGTATHELYVFRTDLPADELPVDNGEVPKTGDGVEFVAEVEDIAPGTTKPLTVGLDAGSYVLLCNLPGHYETGMRTAFDVV